MAVYRELTTTSVEIQCDGNYTLTAEESEEFRYSSSQTILLTVILPFILIFGVCGNLMFIYVALRISHMHTITNRYLVSLAVADVVFLCSAVGHKLWKYALSPLQGDDSPLGIHGCIGIYFLSDAAYFSSLISVSLVTVDRFMAVCRPQNRDSVVKVKSNEIIVTSWILSGVLAAFFTPGNAEQYVYCMNWPNQDRYKTWPDVIRYCSPLNNYVWISSISTGLQAVPFVVTFVLNIFLYVSIIRGLNKCIKRRNQHTIQTANNDKEMRNKIAKMLVVNGIVFFCLLAPFEILSFFSMIASLRGRGQIPKYLIFPENVRQYILLIAQVCSYMNSAVNPIVYTVMCRRYRQAFREALLPVKCFNRNRSRVSYSCRTEDVQTEANKKTDV